MSTQEKLVRLSAGVAEARKVDPKIRWALIVPNDPSDAEWIVRVGAVECVAGDLDGAIDAALGEVARVLSWS